MDSNDPLEPLQYPNLARKYQTRVEVADRTSLTCKKYYGTGPWNR
jgi:hypothetical protein